MKIWGLFRNHGVVLFALSSLLVGSNAVAQNQCLDLFTESNDYSHYLSKMVQWNEQLGDLSPGIIHLQMDPMELGASGYESLEHRIRLGAVMGSHTRTDAEAVLGHEYGHAVFFRHFEFNTQDARIELNYFTGLAHETHQILELDPQFQQVKRDFERHKALMEKSMWNEDIDKAELHREQALKFQEQIDERTEPIRMFLHLSEMLTAYNELFADLFVVVHTKDPNSIFNAIREPGLRGIEVLRHSPYSRKANFAEDVAAPRSFVGNINFKNWKNEASNQYTFFDPMRIALWNLYVKNLPAQEIPLFLKTYLEAAGRHVTVRIARQEDIRVSQNKQEPGPLNQEFLRIFVQTAREMGLAIRKD